jgi:hypothetical protein
VKARKTLISQGKMPRISLRVSRSAAPRSSSKRPTSAADIITDQGPKNKRAKQQSGPKKTKSTSPEESEVDLEDEDVSSGDDGSGYEGSQVEEPSEDELEEEAEDSSEEEPAQRRKSGGNIKRAGSGKATTPASAKGRSTASKEVWRQGVKTGMGPGTQVVFKKPRARSPGDTPYTDETIHPNTMLFLEDLAANNDRQWLKSM